MEFTALKSSDIEVGQPLLWPVYDGAGGLLLNEGFVVENEKIKALILQRNGLINRSNTSDQNKTLIKTSESSLSCIELLSLLAGRLDEIERKISERETHDLLFHVRNLAIAIEYLVDKYTDRILAIVMIEGIYEYHIMHPLQTAVYCELIAKSKGIPCDERIALLCAALTHDSGIRALQKKMDDKPFEKISTFERAAIKKHPDAAYRRLKDAGVKSTKWLTTVLHHHERLDGSGYPRGLHDNDCSEFDKIITVADSFSAMTRKRSYREQINSENALESLLEEGDKYCNKNVIHLIGALGLVSPGSMIVSRDGCICIVVGRENSDGFFVALPIVSNSGAIIKKPEVVSLKKEDVDGFLSRYEFSWIFLEFDKIWPKYEGVLL